MPIQPRTLSSEKDDDAAFNPAKRPQTLRDSNIHDRDNKMNMEEDSKTISTTNAQYLVRTGGVNTMPLTHFTIPTPYIHSHNECNAIKALKGTKFKPFRALLAPPLEIFPPLPTPNIGRR